MKKLYAFFAAALLAAPTFAQKEVVLVNPNDGKEYTDGQTMIIHPEVDPEWGDVTFHSPSVKNKGKSDVTVSFDFTPTFTNGTFQCCWGGSCRNFDANETHNSATDKVKAGDTVSLLTEWSCLEGYDDDWNPIYNAGTCTCTFVLYVNGAKGNSYTVKYVYEKEAEGIQQATLNNKQQKTYDLQGRVASQDAKGLLIKGGKKVIR